MKRKVSISKLTISIGGTLAAGTIGYLFTIPHVESWYRFLKKPFFTPPDWVFDQVWAVLYGIIGIAAYLVWTSKSSEARRRALLFYVFQLILNTLWSVIFFGAQAPTAGLAVILLLLTAAIITTRDFLVVRWTAGILMVPYILWILFAAALNAGIVALNLPDWIAKP